MGKLVILISDERRYNTKIIIVFFGGEDFGVAFLQDSNRGFLSRTLILSQIFSSLGLVS